MSGRVIVLEQVYVLLEDNAVRAHTDLVQHCVAWEKIQRDGSEQTVIKLELFKARKWFVSRIRPMMDSSSLEEVLAKVFGIDATKDEDGNIVELYVAPRSRITGPVFLQLLLVLGVHAEPGSYITWFEEAVSEIWQYERVKPKKNLYGRISLKTFQRKRAEEKKASARRAVLTKLVEELQHE